MSDGSRFGTFASTASMINADRSSGRQSISDPLFARPIGVRAVATITASGIESSRDAWKAQDSVEAVASVAQHVKEDHKSHRAGWLRAAVLGANDGIVSTASLVIGVAA